MKSFYQQCYCSVNRKMGVSLLARGTLVMLKRTSSCLKENFNKDQILEMNVSLDTCHLIKVTGTVFIRIEAAHRIVAALE